MVVNRDGGFVQNTKHSIPPESNHLLSRPLSGLRAAGILFLGWCAYHQQNPGWLLLPLCTADYSDGEMEGRVSVRSWQVVGCTHRQEQPARPLLLIDALPQKKDLSSARSPMSSPDHWREEEEDRTWVGWDTSCCIRSTKAPSLEINIHLNKPFFTS